MKTRVVITGLGVIAPNAYGVEAYEKALREGKSGISFQPELKELNFGCQVAGVVQEYESIVRRYFSEEQLLGMNSSIKFACIAATDAWKDAGLEIPGHDVDYVNWDTGAIVGTGIGGMDTIGDKLIPFTNAGKVRRMGSTMVEQVMASGVSAKISGLFALGNQVTTNSSACSTGTEAVIEATNRIRQGFAKRMLAGGAEGISKYIWAGFDAMRVLNRDRNDEPEKASRPMSESAGGFIPGSGSGIIMLESLDSALERKAKIYAEVVGTALNCGGQRMGGSMTAPNPESVRRCIREALKDANIRPTQIDTINGHLTATFADPYEVQNWVDALEVAPKKLPLINSTKSLVGHALGAAGGLEVVACALQLSRGFIHGSVNCEDLHEKIKPCEASVVHKTQEVPGLEYQAKASFGFGDVNSCLILKKWKG
ncbi:MAG: beta-ketoacyl-[acyl-carrier-protein] synthase family protein [Candidatus Omnitrophica bacterium]|nr:beta-ketoacyl-[acyl-carrier-protein] synthase family protein [Candidatus Omnitrophota bacterium]